ncbi:MAG: cytoplasmic protein [Thermodesulfobacteriota bacterium]|nr:cytoplasmic protein [Thermodesulfobacteriota bacterium]
MTSHAIPESLKPIAAITNTALPAGRIGAVVARAGVGKTPFLVQVALNGMFYGKNVLHINLSATVKKTVVWYKEMFSHMAVRHSLGGVTLDDLIARRFIMTLKTTGFSVAGLQERISDLQEQNIFSPDILVVDGLSFEESRRSDVSELKALGDSFGLKTWVSVPAHRDEPRDKRGMPARITEVADLFDLIWELLPEGKKILVTPLKQIESVDEDAMLFMDPASMQLDASKTAS